MNIESAPVVASAANASRPAKGGAPVPEAPLLRSGDSASAAQATSLEDLRKSIDAIKEWLPEPVRTDLSFRVEDQLRQVVVSVVESGTGKVVRQIPADVVIRVARNLQKFLGGLVDEVA